MLHYLRLFSSQKYGEETTSDPLTDLSIKLSHENCGNGTVVFERYIDDYHRYILLCKGRQEHFMIQENLRMIIRKLLINGRKTKITSCWTIHQHDNVEILISTNQE